MKANPLKYAVFSCERKLLMKSLIGNTPCILLPFCKSDSKIYVKLEEYNWEGSKMTPEKQNIVI